MSNINVETLRAQIDAQYQADITALERVKRVMEDNYQQRIAWLDQLRYGLPDALNLEYVPPEDPNPPPTPRPNTPQTLAHLTPAGEPTPHEPETTPVDEEIQVLKHTNPDAEGLYRVIRTYGGPVTAAELTRALEKLGTPLEIGRVKLTLNQLIKHQLVVRHVHQSPKGPTTYYQDARARTPIDQGIRVRLRDRQLRRQETPTLNPGDYEETEGRPARNNAPATLDEIVPPPVRRRSDDADQPGAPPPHRQKTRRR
jgi:hypothetical protein